MEPKIKIIKPKKLIGKRLTMSFADFNMAELWKSFMPHKNLIKNVINSDLISMAIYQPDHFNNFKPTNVFDKWAAVEVSNFGQVSDRMETYVLPGGLYAVFDYKGLNTDPTIYRYIYSTWLPGSNYQLDQLPHFEILGEKYRNNDPNSEEEICIPVKRK